MEDFKALGAIIAIAGPTALWMYGEFKSKKPVRGAEYNEARIVTPAKTLPKKTAKPAQNPAEKPTKPLKPAPSTDTIKAMHIQADAERATADALTRKAQREPDPVKRARLEKQIANSNLRFNKILDQIDKLTSQL